MFCRRSCDSPKARGDGLTLVELLVVILIIGIVFALVGATLLRGSIANREAARLLHGALVGARDAAIGHNAPRGIRLVLDPAFPIKRLPSGQVDPSSPLYANRIVPIEPAPDYSEGRVSIIYPPYHPPPPGFPPSYLGSKTDVYPCYDHVLMVEESPMDPSSGLVNSPTSWFWNVRIGDRIRIDGSGIWYTVVGPMTTVNSELFVNCGTPGVDFPGTKSPLQRTYNSLVEVEFLFLVNGRDDDGDGFVDNGFDGVDNNGNGVIDDLAEWEVETWAAAQTTGVFNAGYTISRRPVPSAGAGLVALPSSIVIDLTTWGTTRERSRLPVNTLSGCVDILLSPRGEVIPTTVYSSPSSVGMGSAYLHFWLADRGDLFDPDPSSFPHLPLPQGLAPNSLGRELKGDVSIVSLNARTGQITTTTPTGWDTANVGTLSYNPAVPFRDAEQGAR